MITKPEQMSVEDWHLVEKAFRQLLHDYLQSNHRKRTEKIIKAFNLANHAHSDAKRKSGEPYILHPIAVAEICCNEIGLGSTSITAALLHDVVEDTEYTVQDIRDMFGNTIATIVDGLTKLSGEILAQSHPNAETSAQLENIRRLLLTANSDIRVILVKIADRLHNMRTLDSMPEAKQAKIAAETRLFYSPLAERLGMYGIMGELQDLSLKYDHPQEYAEVQKKIALSSDSRESLFEQFKSALSDDLDKTGLRYELHYRTKSVFSIWRKMKKKHVNFDEIYDIFAIRIIFDPLSPETEYSDCFRLYRIISSHFRIKDDRIRDWLTRPKENGYQALHITVMGPSGKWIEVQIRSRRMQEMAERGLAAHWRYKAQADVVDEVEDKILNNVRALLSNPGPNASDDYETMMYKFSIQEMLIFTSKGEQMRCPVGITVLDFAYLLDEEMGHHCIGAKVNHNMVNIDYVLNNGDQIEVLTTNKTFPKPEWLYYVKTPQARRAIQNNLQETRRRHIEEGQEIFKKFARPRGIDPKDLIKERGSVLKYPSRDDFYFAVYNQEQPLDDQLIKDLQEAKQRTGSYSDIVDRYTPWESDESEVPSLPPEKRKEIYTLKAYSGKRNYIRALCCKPVLGEDVHGILNEHNQVVVHKKYCPSAIKLKAMRGDSIVNVAWGPHVNSTFGVTYEIEGVNLDGFVYQLIGTLRQMHIPLTGIDFTSAKDRAIGTIKVRVPNINVAEQLIVKLRDENELLRIMRLDIQTEIEESSSI